MPQLYLIASSDAKWNADRREELVESLVPREMRDENLLELYSTSSNKPLRLDDILPEILSELSTIPFLPDSRRVVVVHDLQDLFLTGRPRQAKKTSATPKRSAVESLQHFVQHDLPATENALIFCNTIHYEKGQQFDKDGPLAKVCRPPHGETLRPPRREVDPLFQLSDALMARDASACLRHFRAIHNSRNDFRIFREILRVSRLMLQCKILELARKKGMGQAAIDSLLPPDKSLNLNKQADFVQQKIRQGAARYQLRELMAAMDRLHELNRWLIPTQDDLYAPDYAVLMESFLIELCQGAIAPRPALRK